MSDTPASHTPDPASPGTAPMDEGLTPDDLKALLADAEARCQQQRDQHLRAVAELDNVRKRAQRDVEQAHRFGIERLAQELLPVKDSLDLAVENAGRADAAALAEGQAATLRLLQAAGAQHLLHSGGNLHRYESEAEWKASLPGWQLRAQHGIAFEHAHGAAAIARWQPGLAPTLVAATFVPGWQTIQDPRLLCHTVSHAFRAAGGRLRQAAVQALKPQASHVALPLADGRRVQAQHVVLAAGAWSHQLAATLGERIPLETERGYNTTLPPGAFALQRQLTFPGHGFVVTPIAGGVRVGGAVELAGLKAPPNYRRADVLLGKAQRFLPGLRSTGGTQWMGFRPSLPDSLPAIGPSRTDTRITHAFGHGHLGLTQSAATAEIVAALVAGQRPPLSLQPFNPARFE